jgi:WD40 repeat protein
MKSDRAPDGDPRNDRPEEAAAAPDSESGTPRHELPAATAAELLRQLLAQKTQTTSLPPSAPLRVAAPLAPPRTEPKPRPPRIPIRVRWERFRQHVRTRILSRAARRVLVVVVFVAGGAAVWQWYWARHPPGLVETIPASSGNLTTLAVGGDGRWIATGSGTGQVALWDRQRRQMAPVRSSTSLPVSGLRFTTDQFLIAGGVGKRLQVWSLKNFEALDIPLLPAPITAVAVHPRRPEIVIGLQNGRLAVLDSVSGEFEDSDAGHVGWARTIEFHPAGSWFVTGGADGRLIVRDGETREQSRGWLGHATDVSSLSISADGHTLASADWSGLVKLWRMPDGEVLRELPHPDGVSGVIVHGSRLVTSAWDGRIRVWTLDDGRPVGSIATGQPISALSLAANGRHAVTVSPSNSVQIWRLP